MDNQTAYSTPGPVIARTGAVQCSNRLVQSLDVVLLTLQQPGNKLVTIPGVKFLDFSKSELSPVYQSNLNLPGENVVYASYDWHLSFICS